MTISYQNYLILKQYLDENSSENYTYIANKIDTDEVLPKWSPRTIRRYLSFVDSGDIDIVDKSEEITDIVIDPYMGSIDYSIKFNGNNFEIPQRQLDSIYCAYSRKGLNYTREQVIQNMNISEELFNAVSSGKYAVKDGYKQLNLSKESVPYGPITADSDDYIISERLEFITNKLINLFVDNSNPVVASVIRKYKKEAIKLNSINEVHIKALNNLAEALDRVKIKSFGLDISPIDNGDYVYIAMGDQHIGMEADNYNTNIAKKAFKYVANLINTKYKDKKIVLLLLGDLMHSVSGKNHEDTWKTLEGGMWGANSIIAPYEMLAQFILEVPNIAEVYAVGGNHSRLSASKKDESSDEGEKLVFYMLSKTIGRPVTFDPDIVKVNFDKINFILMHGDRAADKKSAESIAWTHGDPNKFNMILLGHTHSRQIDKGNDSINFRKIVCPSFCPSDAYADSLGFNTLAGFYAIEILGDKPVVVDYPIDYEKLKIKDD